MSFHVFGKVERMWKQLGSVGTNPQLSRCSLVSHISPMACGPNLAQNLFS